MLSRFFSKSQPIVFVVLALYLFGGFFLAFLYDRSTPINLLLIGKKTGVYLLLVLILLLINFICKRNKIDHQNSYAILFFTILSLNYPQGLIGFEPVFVAMLSLLFMRRVLNLKNHHGHKKKIFEASFFLYFIVLLQPALTPLIIVLYAGIATYSYGDVKNFLVPLVAFFSAFMLCQIYTRILNDEWFYLLSFFDQINLRFSFYDTNRLRTGFFMTVLFTLYMTIMVLKDMGKTNVQRRSILRLISFSGLMILASALFLGGQDGDILFTYHAVIALQAGNILKFKKKWVNEAIILFFAFSGAFTWFSGLVNV